MHTSASILNSSNQNEVYLATNNQYKQLTIPAKAEGKGSAANGGELLFLALASCFCNDVNREAAKRRLDIKSVNVTVTGEFGGEGEPGFNIEYEAKAESDSSAQEINDLIPYVDKIAEVHNTLRAGTSVTLKQKSLM